MDALGGCAAGDTTASGALPGSLAIATTLTVVGLSLYALLPSRPKFIRGPLTTKIPTMSEAEIAKVTYTPDHFPGARDVATPVRVFLYHPSPPALRFEARLLCRHALLTVLLHAVWQHPRLRIRPGRRPQGALRPRHQHFVHDTGRRRPASGREGLPRHAFCE